MRIGTVLAVSLLLATGACSDPAGPDNPRVEIRTDLTSYGPGEEGVLTFTNRQRSPVWVNMGLCLTLIEERIDGEWRDVGTFGLLTDGSTACALGNTTVHPDQSLSRSLGAPGPHLDFPPPGNEVVRTPSVADHGGHPGASGGPIRESPGAARAAPGVTPPSPDQPSCPDETISKPS